MATIAFQPPSPSGLGPDRIVMVARVLGIDGDDRQMGQVLALAERQLRDAMRLVDRLLRELVRAGHACGSRSG